MQSNTRRGSVLIGSLVLIIVAAMAVGVWMSYVAHAARSADRDRARMHAFYAAEAGVEQVVEYFNHPTRYLGDLPDDYVEQAIHPDTIELAHPVYPDFYEVFEGYITSYAQNGEGLPINRLDEIIWDDRNDQLLTGTEPVVLGHTYFRDRAGTPAEISLTSKIPSFELDLEENDALIFRGRGDRIEASVTRIEVIHPGDLPEAELLQAAAAQGPIICKVISTAEASNGVTMRVESMITQNIIPNISSPAAIISESGVSFDGNFEVHWGEVWANSNVELPVAMFNKLPRLGDTYRTGNPGNPGTDPWFRMRTIGHFFRGTEFADGRLSSGFGPNMLTQIDGELYRTPYHASARPANLSPGQKWEHDGRDNLYQNQTLNFPSYEYDHWKNFFTVYDLPYFFTDTSGRIYGRDRDPRSLTYGQIVSKDYHEWFDSDPSESEQYWDYDGQFAFIDSVPVDDDGNPAPIVNGVPVINDTYFPRGPGDPAHLFADVSIAGNGTHTRGVMFGAANFKATGTGNPPRASAVVDENGDPTVLMPDGTDGTSGGEDFRIFHNGLFYSWGQIDFGGNRSVYGSVYAEQGYAAGGTPTVYYNNRLRDGAYFGINQSLVRRTLWDVNRPILAEVE